MGFICPLHFVLFLIAAISAEELPPDVFPSLKDTIDGIKNTPKVKYIKSATLMNNGGPYVYEIKYKAQEGTDCIITIEIQKDGSSSDVYKCSGKVDDLSPLTTWDNDASQGVKITNQQETGAVKDKIDQKSHVPGIAQLLDIRLVSVQSSKHYFVKYISKLGTLCRLTLIMNEDGGGSEKVMCTDTKEKDDDQENSEVDENEQTEWRRITKEEKSTLIHDVEKASGTPVGENYIDGFLQFRGDNSTKVYIIWYYDSEGRRCAFKQETSGLKDSKFKCNPFEYPDLLSEDKKLMLAKGEKLQALLAKMKGVPTVDAVITSRKESHPGGSLYRGVYRATNGDVCKIVIIAGLNFLNPKEMHTCTKSDENSEPPRTLPGYASDEEDAAVVDISEEDETTEDEELLEREPDLLGVKVEVTPADQKLINKMIGKVERIPKQYKMESIDKRISPDKDTVYTISLSYSNGDKCRVLFTFKSEGDFDKGTHDCELSNGEGEAEASKEVEPSEARQPAKHSVTDIGEEPADDSASDEAKDQASGGGIQIGEEEMRIFMDTMNNSVEAPEIDRILRARKKELQHFTFYRVHYLSKDGQICSVRLRIFVNGVVKPVIKCKHPEKEMAAVDENAADSETELRPDDLRKIEELILEQNWEEPQGILGGSKVVSGTSVLYRFKYTSKDGKVCKVAMTVDVNGNIQQKRHKCSVENSVTRPTEDAKSDTPAKSTKLQTKDIRIIQIYANKKLKWGNKILEVTQGSKEIIKEGVLYRFQYNSIEDKHCTAQIIIRFDGSSGDPTYNRCESNVEPPLERFRKSDESEEKPQETQQRQRRRRLRAHIPDGRDEVSIEVADDVVTRSPIEKQSFEILSSGEWDHATEVAPDPYEQDSLRTSSNKDHTKQLGFPSFPKVTGDDTTIKHVKLTPEEISGFEKIMGHFRRTPPVSKIVGGTKKNTGTKKIYWVRYQSKKSRHPLNCSITVSYDKADGSLLEQHVCNKLAEEPQEVQEVLDESGSDEIETLIKTVEPHGHPITKTKKSIINTLRPGKKLSPTKIRKITALIHLFKGAPRPEQIRGFTRVKINDQVVFNVDYLAEDGRRCDMKITKMADGSLFENHQCTQPRPAVSVEETQPHKGPKEAEAISLEGEDDAARPILTAGPNKTGNTYKKEAPAESESSQANHTLPDKTSKSKLLTFIEQIPGLSKFMGLFKIKPHSTSAQGSLLQNNNESKEKRPKSEKKKFTYREDITMDKPTTKTATDRLETTEEIGGIPTAVSPERESGYGRKKPTGVNERSSYYSNTPTNKQNKFIGVTEISPTNRPKRDGIDESELIATTDSIPRHLKKKDVSDKKNLVGESNIPGSPKVKGRAEEKKIIITEENDSGVPRKNTASTDKFENNDQEFFGRLEITSGKPKNNPRDQDELTTTTESTTASPKTKVRMDEKKLESGNLTVAKMHSTAPGSKNKPDILQEEFVEAMNIIPKSSKTKGKPDKKKIITIAVSTPGNPKKRAESSEKELFEAGGIIPGGPKNAESDKEELVVTTENGPGSPKKAGFDKDSITITNGIPKKKAENVGEKIFGAAAIIPPRLKKNESKKQKVIAAESSVPGRVPDKELIEAGGIIPGKPKNDKSDKEELVVTTENDPGSPQKTRFDKDLITVIDGIPKKQAGNVKEKIIGAAAIIPPRLKKNESKKQKVIIAESSVPGKVPDKELIEAGGIIPGGPKNEKSDKEELAVTTENDPDSPQKTRFDKDLITITNGIKKKKAGNVREKIIGAAATIPPRQKNNDSKKQKIIAEKNDVPGRFPKNTHETEESKIINVIIKDPKKDDEIKNNRLIGITTSNPKKEGEIKNNRLIEVTTSNPKMNNEIIKFRENIPNSPKNEPKGNKDQLTAASDIPDGKAKNIETDENEQPPITVSIPGHSTIDTDTDKEKTTVIDGLPESPNEKAENDKQEQLMSINITPGSQKKVTEQTTFHRTGSIPGNTKEYPNIDHKTLIEVSEGPKEVRNYEQTLWEAREITSATPRKGVKSKKRRVPLRGSVTRSPERPKLDGNELIEEAVSIPSVPNKMPESDNNVLSKATNTLTRPEKTTESRKKPGTNKVEVTTKVYTLQTRPNNSDATDKSFLASVSVSPKENVISLKKIIIDLKGSMPDKPKGSGTTERIDVLTAAPTSASTQDAEIMKQQLIEIMESVPGIPKVKEILKHTQMNIGDNRKHKFIIQGEDNLECKIDLQVNKDHQLVREKHACKPHTIINAELHYEDAIPSDTGLREIVLTSDETSELKKALQKVAPIYSILHATSKEKNLKRIYQLKILSLNGQLCNVWAVGNLTGNLLTNATVCHKVWKDDPSPAKRKEENFGPDEGPGNRGIITKELFEVVGKIIYEVLHMPRISEIVHSSVMNYRTRAHGIFEYKSEDGQVCKIFMLLNLANQVLDERHKCLPEDYGEHITDEDLHGAADDRNEVEMDGKDKKELINFAASFRDRKFPEIKDVIEGLTVKTKYTTVYDVKYQTNDGSRCSLKLTIYRRDNSTSYNYECLADLPHIPKYNRKGKLVPPAGERSPLDRKSRLAVLEKMEKLYPNNDIMHIFNGFEVRGMNSTDAYFVKFNTTTGKLCRMWLLVRKDGDKSKLQCKDNKKAEDRCQNQRPYEENGYHQTLTGADKTIILKNMEDPLQPIWLQEGYVTVDGPTRTYHVQFNTKSGAFCRLELKLGEKETSKEQKCTYKTLSLPENPKFDSKGDGNYMNPPKQKGDDVSIETEELDPQDEKSAKKETPFSRRRRRRSRRSNTKDKPKQKEYEGEDISMGDSMELDKEQLHKKTVVENVEDPGKEKLSRDDLLLIRVFIENMKNAPKLLSIGKGFKEKKDGTAHYHVEYSTTNGTCQLEMSVHEDGSSQRQIDCEVAVDSKTPLSEPMDEHTKEPTRKLNETDEKYILEYMSGQTNVPPIKEILGGTVKREKGITKYRVEYSTTTGACTLNMRVNEDGRAEHQMNCTVTEEPLKVIEAPGDGRGKGTKLRKLNEEDDKLIFGRLSELKNLPPIIKITGGTVEENKKGVKRYRIQYSTNTGTCILSLTVNNDGHNVDSVNCILTDPNKISREPKNSHWEEPGTRMMNKDDENYIIGSINKLQNIPPIEKIISGTVETKNGDKQYHVNFSTKNGTCTLSTLVKEDGSAEHHINCTVTKGSHEQQPKSKGEEAINSMKKPQTRRINEADEKFILENISRHTKLPPIKTIIGGTVEQKGGNTLYHVEYYSTTPGLCTLHTIVREDGRAKHHVNCIGTKDPNKVSEDPKVAIGEKPALREINQADKEYILEKMSGHTNMLPVISIIGGTVKQGLGYKHYLVNYSTTSGICTLNMRAFEDGRAERQIHCTVTRDPNKVEGEFKPEEQNGDIWLKPESREINQTDKAYIMYKMSRHTNVPPILEITGGTVEREKGITHYHVKYSTKNGTCTLNMMVKEDGSAENSVNCTISADPNKLSRERKDDSWEMPVSRKINKADVEYIMERMSRHNSTLPIKKIIGGTMEREKGITHYHVEYSTTNGTCTLNMVVNDDGSAENRVNCTVLKEHDKSSGEPKGDTWEKREINEADEKYVLEKMSGHSNMPPVKVIIGGTVEREKGNTLYHVEYSTINGTCTLNMVVRQDGSGSNRVNCTVTKYPSKSSEELKDDNWGERGINETEEQYVREKMSRLTNMPPVKAIIGGTVKREKGITQYHVEYSTRTGTCTLNMKVMEDGRAEHRVNCTVTKYPTKSSDELKDDNWGERGINETEEKYVREKMSKLTNMPPVKAIIGGTVKREKGITQYHVEYSTRTGTCTLNMKVMEDGRAEHRVNCTATKYPTKSSDELKDDNWGERGITETEEKYVREKMSRLNNMPPVKAIIGGTVKREKGITQYHVEYSTTTGTCTLNMRVMEDGRAEHRVNCTVTKDPNQVSLERKDGTGDSETRKINEDDVLLIIDKMKGLQNMPPIKEITGGIVEITKDSTLYKARWRSASGQNCKLKLEILKNGEAKRRAKCVNSLDDNSFRDKWSI